MLQAAQLALVRGWAFNIGGGFHHCCAEMGGGFCAYADITLAVRFLFERTDIEGRVVSKAMIVDLDAHQGNGYARDFMGDDRVYILDVYNADIYPHDTYAKGMPQIHSRGQRFCSLSIITILFIFNNHNFIYRKQRNELQQEQ